MTAEQVSAHISVTTRLLPRTRLPTITTPSTPFQRADQRTGATTTRSAGRAVYAQVPEHRSDPPLPGPSWRMGGGTGGGPSSSRARERGVRRAEQECIVDRSPRAGLGRCELQKSPCPGGETPMSEPDSGGQGRGASCVARIQGESQQHRRMDLPTWTGAGVGELADRVPWRYPLGPVVGPDVSCPVVSHPSRPARLGHHRTRKA